MKYDPKELRRAFGTFMTGVTVVTTKSSDDTNIGFTANSFTSVSLDPPLLSVCLAKSMNCCTIFENCSNFVINILAEAQEDVSNLFASFDGDRFAEVDWKEDTDGIPIIDGVTSSFSCSNYQLIDAGDHFILIGRINNFTTTGNEGLGYSNQGYFSLGLERAAVEANKSISSFKVGVVIEAEGEVLLVDSDNGLELPNVKVQNRSAALNILKKHIETEGIYAEFGPVYSIFENQKTGEYSIYFLAKSKGIESTNLGDYYSIEKLPKLAMSSNSIQVMMNRYALETQIGVFGLYLGDENKGDVHAIA